MELREKVRFVDVRGIRTALRSFSIEGREPAPAERRPSTVLLLHGFLDAGSSWARVAGPIAEAGFEVVAPDFRGFGESGWIGAGGYYYFADYIADVREIVRHLAPRALHVVGHSMGGGVATLFASAVAPPEMKTLVCAEGMGPPDEPATYAVGRMKRWLADLDRVDRTPRAMKSLDEAVERLAATHPRIDRGVLREVAGRLAKKREDGSFEWRYDPLHRTASPNTYSVAVLRSFLEGIAVPTLYIGGGPMGWRPPDEDERLALIKDLEKTSIDDAGHMMHWTRPLEMAERIVAFVKKHDA